MAGDLLQRGNAKAVIFIDTGIADWQTLANDAPEGADIVTLDSTRDGLAQMAQWAQTHSGYDAIHIISHGSEGQISLGNFTLDARAINTRASDLAQLGAALNEEGDLLLYGCSVASGEGQDFIAALAQATQADVAASDDLTGAASLGGDWELEAVSSDGAIETQTFSALDFQGVLSTITFDNVAQNGNYAVTVTDQGRTIQVTTAVAAAEFTQVDAGGAGGSTGNVIGDLYGSGLASVTFTFDVAVDVSSIQLVEVGDRTAGNYIFTPNSGNAVEVAANISTDIGGYHGITVNALNFTNITSFSVTYSEGQFTPLFDNLVFEMASTNAAPTITGAPSNITVTEDTASNVDLSDVTLADSDGDNLTVTLTASAGTLAASSGGSVTVSGAGTGALTLAGTAANINTYLNTTSNIQYTGASNASGNSAATLSIKANDGTVDSSTTTVNVDITAVNDTPVFTSSSKASVAENTTAVTTLVATDADGDTLTYSISGGADQALFSLDSNSGALTFINAPDFEAPGDSNSDNAYDVEVTAGDGQGDTTPLTLTVTVTNVNEEPTLSANAKLSVPENTTGTVYTATGSDPENAQLFYTLSGTDAGLFNLDTNTGALSFKNAPDYEAPADAGGNNIYNVNLTANDGSLNSAPQALLISVANVDDANAAPVFTSSSKANVTENSTAVATLMATDADGDTLTYSITGGADQALFNLDTKSGALTFNSAPDFETPADSNSDNAYDVEVTAGDGQGGTTPLTLTVTVTDTNEAPTLTGATKANVSENTTGTIYTATGSDPENNPLTYALSGTDAALFDLNANSGALSFKNAPDFEAPGDAGGNNVYDVILTASDGSLNSSPQTLTITVTDINDAPVFTSSSKASVAENTTAVTTLAATDADGDTLTYSITGGADQALFSLNANSGALSFINAPDFEAPNDQGKNNQYEVIVNVDDGTKSASQAVTITVTDVNETQPPTPEPVPTPPPIQVTPPEPLPNTPSGRPSIKETITNTGSEQGTAKLVENSGNANQVTATLPGGVSIVNQGARTAVDPFQALDDLVNSINAQQPTNLDEQTGVASQWLANRPQGTLLDIRTIVISDSGRGSIDTPVQITGIGNDNSSHQEAFVIDVRLLPQGNRLQLDNIDFASIIGETIITGGAGANVIVADDAAQTIVLGEDDDELHAGGGRDLVGSKGGDDLIFGEAGYDRLFGGEGNDVLNGGSGVDVARFTIDAASAELRYADDGSLMVSAGELGIDTLISIELLRFDDQVLLVNAPAPQSVMGFNEASYLAANSDVAMAVARGDFESGIAHYAQHGRQEGRRGELNGFDEAFYLAQNPDVAAAVSRGEFVSGFHHYMRWGDGEGRDPNVLFDEAWYRAQNSDVNRAIELGVFDNAYEHYLAFGSAEQRLPSAWFDTADYLASNQDVAEALFNPVLHYLAYGVNEGRVIVADDAGLWG